MTIDSYINLASVNITTVTGAAFCIFVTSLLSYVIYAFSIREKSFEEVIEEQRKREQEEQQQKTEKLKKDKEKEKKHKKWAKKAKEKNDQAMETVKDVAIQEGQNELNNDIEIIEPIKKKNKVPVKQNNVAVQPPTKNSSVVEKPVKAVTETPTLQQDEKEKKSIKEERSSSKEEPITKKDAVVKDEKKPKLDVKEKEKKQEIQKDAGLHNPQATQTETIQIESAAQIQVSPVITNKKKKKLDHLEKEDHIPMTANKLISLIKETPLEESDNQMLINTLLNKQKEASEWKKTGDNQNIKKQRDASIAQDRQKQNATMKSQDMCLVAKTSSADRVMNSKLEAQQNEIQVLNARIKQTEEALLHEKKIAEEKTAELEKTKLENAANMTAIKKLEDEKLQLAKTLKRLESESKAIDAASELEKVKKSKDELQKVHTLLVEQHTQIHAAHNSETKKLTNQIMEVTKILEKTQFENKTLSDEMGGWKSKLENADAAKVKVEQEHLAFKQSSQKEIKNLKALLEESKKRTQELDNQLKDVKEKLEDLTRKNNQLSAELTTMQNENERLSAELAASNERVSGDGQEMMQQNGEVNGKVNEEQSIIVEKEKSLLEKEDIIKQLRKEMEDLSKEIEVQKQKNNELKEKNWKTMEELNAAKSVAEQKIKEAEKLANEKLQKKMEEVKESISVQEAKVSATLQEAKIAGERISELEEQLRITSANSVDTEKVKELSERLCQTEKKFTALQEECNKNQQKHECTVNDNNRLNAEIKKLKDSEVSLLDQIKAHEASLNELNSTIRASESNSKECLQRLFPSVQLQESLPFNEWLVQLETQVRSEFQKITDSEKQINELQVQLKEITKLRDEKEKELNKHIGILSETEKMLKDLSESAKATEAEYSEKLNIKEQQLEKALNDLVVVEKLKEELSSDIKELDQLREKHAALQSSSQDKVTELERKYEEVNNNYLNLQGQIESKVQEMTKLQEEIGSVDKLRKELDELRSKLEKEKEINKNFNTQMVKLNSLVKIGQDALQQEQETVKKLQSQLSEKLATTNGTSSPPAIPEDASGKK